MEDILKYTRTTSPGEQNTFSFKIEQKKDLEEMVSFKLTDGDEIFFQTSISLYELLLGTFTGAYNASFLAM